MPKRKRSDDISVEAILSERHHALHQALKNVRGFERQRQSKRLRDARSTPDKKARIENEIVVLKVIAIQIPGLYDGFIDCPLIAQSLDLQQAARAHLTRARRDSTYVDACGRGGIRRAAPRAGLAAGRGGA